MKNPIKLIFTVLLLSFCFVSCDKDDEPANQHELVGTWKNSQNYTIGDNIPYVETTTITFNSDFSGVINYTYDGDIDNEEFADWLENFTWSAENGSISIDSDYTGGINDDTVHDTEGYYEIDGDDLTLSLEYEGTGIFSDVVYTRVQ